MTAADFTHRPERMRLNAAKNGRLCVFDHGFVYAGMWPHDDFTTRYLASVILSIDGQPFQMATDTGVREIAAIAFRPFIKRSLSAMNGPILSVGVGPNHPCYRAFRALGDEGLLVLDRAAFDPQNERMREALEGHLDGREPAALVQAICETLALQLPEPEPIDPRVQRVLDMLDERPNDSLDVLAQAVDLSYDRLSHLFSDCMGLPLRSYALAQKIHRAAQLMGRGLNLTEIALAAGFADSAHFSRVWVKTFGASPSTFFNKPGFQVKNAITQETGYYRKR